MFNLLSRSLRYSAKFLLVSAAPTRLLLLSHILLLCPSISHSPLPNFSSSFSIRPQSVPGRFSHTGEKLFCFSYLHIHVVTLLSNWRHMVLSKFFDSVFLSNHGRNLRFSRDARCSLLSLMQRTQPSKGVKLNSFCLACSYSSQETLW